MASRDRCKNNSLSCHQPQMVENIEHGFVDNNDKMMKSREGLVVPGE